MKLATITGKYIGQPFETHNCIQIIRDIYADLGFAIPEEHGGYTPDNYLEAFRKDPELLEIIMVEGFAKKGKQIKIKDVCIGDLVFLKGRAGRVFPGIYVGDSKVITSTIQEGVTIAPMGKINRPVMARRYL